MREWFFKMEATGFDTADIRVITAVFCADDGLIAACDPTFLQDAFNLLIDFFDHVGLETNSAKTKVIVFLPGRIRTCLSEDVHLSRLDALHQADRKGDKVECHMCRRKFWKRSLAFYLASCLAAQDIPLPPAGGGGHVPARGRDKDLVGALPPRRVGVAVPHARLSAWSRGEGGGESAGLAPALQPPSS